MTDNITSVRPGGIDADLQRVEAALRASVTTDDPLLDEMAAHLIVAGGKRLRPQVGLAAAACSAAGLETPLPEPVIQGGVAVELVHLGSLYHDDVIDEAEIRRQSDSVNARWGNLRAILAGDFLLARASEIAASLSTEIAGLLAATIARLCEGEVGELRTAFDVERSEEEYLDSIGGKTASLFSTAARIGALTSDQSREAVDTLGEFGWCYGMAFQILDDILDLTATEDELGKPVGNDLVEGVYTLPVLRVLARPEGAELASLLGGPIEGEALDRARGLVIRAGGIDEATGAMESWLDRADATVGVFEGRPGAASLRALTGRVRGRL